MDEKKMRRGLSMAVVAAAELWDLYNPEEESENPYDTQKAVSYFAEVSGSLIPSVQEGAPLVFEWRARIWEPSTCTCHRTSLACGRGLTPELAIEMLQAELHFKAQQIQTRAKTEAFMNCEGRQTS